MTPWIIGAALAFLAITAGAVWLIGCVAEAMRGAAAAVGPTPADEECGWCRKPGRLYSPILPRDCTCTQECSAPWCQLRPVTA